MVQAYIYGTNISMLWYKHIYGINLYLWYIYGTHLYLWYICGTSLYLWCIYGTSQGWVEYWTKVFEYEYEYC